MRQIRVISDRMDRGLRALGRASRLAVAAAGVLVLGLNLTACDKIQEAAQKMQPGKAALDSMIPPGLSPQFFPPDGFVWGAYRPGSLPEVRYGVASPPVNPKAQVLILADPAYPAEVYFLPARQLVDAGYGVWLLEVPGQGGAGRYLLQPDAIYSPNWRDGQIAASDFIRDIVKPAPDKPLVIVGSGFSAINALGLSGVDHDPNILGYVGFDPYLGGPIARGQAWHANDVPGTYWGNIAQSWQGANPNLRLRVKSDVWQRQMTEAFNDLEGPRLPDMGNQPHAQVLVLEPKTGLTADANAASKLCAHVAHCTMVPSTGPEQMGTTVAGFVDEVLPKAK